MIRLCPTFSAAYAGRSHAWIQKGETAKADEDHREAVELDPSSAEVYLVQRFVVEAAFHQQREEFHEAVACTTEAIALDAECPPAWSTRAAAYWYSGQLVEAVEDYSRLLELVEDSAAAYSGRGQVFAEMGEFQSALDDLNRAIRADAGAGSTAVTAYALSGRALAYAGMGRFQEASADFEESIRNSPANAWVHYNHGLMYHQMGNSAAAATCFQLALKLDDPALPPRKRDRAEAICALLPDAFCAAVTAPEGAVKAIAKNRIPGRRYLHIGDVRSRLPYMAYPLHA